MGITTPASQSCEDSVGLAQLKSPAQGLAHGERLADGDPGEVRTNSVLPVYKPGNGWKSIDR